MRPLDIGVITLLFMFITFGYIIGEKLSPAFFNLEKSIKRLIHVKRYHIHHDFVGLLLVLLSTLVSSIWVKTTLAGFGLGLFIQHIKADGLRLITRD
jgi:hypothetical protein